MNSQSSRIEARQYHWWVALALALSPTLYEWARHLAADDSREFSSLLPVLLMILANRLLPAAEPKRSPVWGITMITGAIALQMVGILADSWTLARLGIPIACLGMAQRLGYPHPRSVFLIFFAVPLPTSIISLTTPWLESSYVWPTAELLNRVFGAGLSTSGPLLLWSGSFFELSAPDGGWITSLILVQLVWFIGLVLAWSVSRTITLCALAMLLVWPLQWLGVLLALAIGITFSPSLAAIWMRWGFHLAIVLSTLFYFRASIWTRPKGKSTT